MCGFSHLRTSLAPLILSLLLGALAGCGKEAPEPVSLEQAKSGTKSAFAKAQGDIKNAANDVAAAIEASDFVGAAGRIEMLSRRQDLEREQREALAAAQIATMLKLQEAANTGDKQASEYLEAHRMGK